jgi:uncharacterized protein (DUF305 family)
MWIHGPQETIANTSALIIMPAAALPASAGGSNAPRPARGLASVRAPDGSTYDTIDAAFVRMMIVHHGQTIELAALATDRAAAPELRALAARISAEQTPEIEPLRAWLRERLLADADPTHDHATMPGRQTDTDTAAVAELANEMAVEQGSEIRRMEQIRVG